MIRLSSPAGPNAILLAPRALLGSLVSFEALLVLYMFAGIYKGDPRFAWIPVDPTGLFFALSVVVGSFIIVFSPIHKKGLPVVFAMVCLVTWFLVSLVWSPSRVYGPDKVFFMATLELWAVIAGALIIAPDPKRLGRLFTLLLLLALWVGIEAVLAYAGTGGDLQMISVGSGDYLLMGRICGLGALVALAGGLYSRGRVTGWLCLVLFLALCFVLAIGGGRGPLLAVALALLIPVGLGIRLTRRKILYSRTLLSVLLLLLAVPVGFALYTTVTDHRLGTVERFERLLAGGDPQRSEGKRADLYAKANEFWSLAPLLGLGAGGWTVAIGNPNYRDYPHNLVAELLVEGGLVALGLFCALLGTVLRPASFERMRRDPQALCAMMLFANTLLNAMVSSDLPGNRPMFMMLGVLALFAVPPVGEQRPPGRAPAPTPEALHCGRPRVGAGSLAREDRGELTDGRTQSHDRRPAPLERRAHRRAAFSASTQANLGGGQDLLWLARSRLGLWVRGNRHFCSPRGGRSCRARHWACSRQSRGRGIGLWIDDGPAVPRWYV